MVLEGLGVVALEVDVLDPDLMNGIGALQTESIGGLYLDRDRGMEAHPIFREHALDAMHLVDQDAVAVDAGPVG